jgi:glycosidase
MMAIGRSSRFGMVAVLAVSTSLAIPIHASETATDPGRCATAPLQLASPDWRDQIIYFAMIDRFDNGDAGNDDQGAGEFDPGDGRRFSGGDLAGLRRRIDYMHELGATALWITPPVANQWWDAHHEYGGYHGYWAEDFMRIDAHFGSLSDYRALSRCLHASDMYLIQDIVVNHVGNFFRYDGAVDAEDPRQGFHINADAKPHSAPTRKPFSLNDVRKARDREATIYHWTPDIVDFNNRTQLLDWQLAGLDDLNTENPAVRRALRDSYGYWIRKAGVDGFRIDTAFYVPPEFFDDFLHARDRKAPGIITVAEQTGHSNFLLFGEGFAMDPPYKDDAARRIDAYMRDGQGRTRLPGMLNFPLYGSTLDVFARGKPTAVLGHRIRNMMQVHTNPHLMPSFVDNHDVDRFLANGNEAGLRQALLLIMGLPGIPVIYYGTEQGFTEQRAAMFKSGFGSAGRDHFDRDAPMYRFIKKLTALRRSHPLLSRGVPKVLAENAAGSGALAWSMSDGEQSLIIVLNSADHEILLADVESGLSAGTRLQALFAIDGSPESLAVAANGRLTMRLPAHSGSVWKVAGKSEAAADSSTVIDIDPLAKDVIDGDLALSGMARGLKHLRLVVDGNLDNAAAVNVDRDGRWHALLDTAEFVDPALEHRVVAWSDRPSAISSPTRFTVRRQWQDRIHVDDPANDDHGPTGKYVYPTDPAWSQHRPLDLRGVGIATSGGSLRVTLEMRELMDVWNPPNGFDHLAATVFLELPGREGGSTLMPLQNSVLPDSMRWHYRLRAGGWSTSLFSATGASSLNEGTPVAADVDVQVDRAGHTLTFTLPAAAIGRPNSLKGARLYITTWDYDGGYRPLDVKPDRHTFGGAQSVDAPRIMDDIGPVILP